MTKTTVYNVLVGMTVAMGSFTYGFGTSKHRDTIERQWRLPARPYNANNTLTLSTSSGFATFATSIGQPGFYEYFDLKTEGPGASYTNHILGAVNALFFFGAIVGALTSGPIADRWGRRLGLISSSLAAITGGALAAGSVHVAMLVIVRVLQGAGLGGLATLTPVYLAEASTPSKRGLLGGLHGFFLVSGYNISAWVGYGASISSNLTFGWRGPIAFTCVPALMLLLGCLWVPESPRWLLMQGRVDEAWANLSRLHHDADDPDQVAASEEFFQMRKQIELEKDNPNGYWAILSTPSYAKRAFLSCFIQFAANGTGGLVINYYSVIIYQNLGMTGHTPLLLYAFYTLVGALGNLGSLLTLDWTGRRPVSEALNNPAYSCLLFANLFEETKKLIFFVGPSDRILWLSYRDGARDFQ